MTDPLPFPPIEMRMLVGPTDLAAFDNPTGAPVFPDIRLGAAAGGSPRVDEIGPDGVSIRAEQGRIEHRLDPRPPAGALKTGVIPNRAVHPDRGPRLVGDAGDACVEQRGDDGPVGAPLEQLGMRERIDPSATASPVRPATA